MGWPPWKTVRQDRQQAAEQVERSAADLNDTIRQTERAEAVASAVRHARARNHFSESMELLLTTRHAPRPHRGQPS